MDLIDSQWDSCDGESARRKAATTQDDTSTS
jgi:hypothetical protein